MKGVNTEDLSKTLRKLFKVLPDVALILISIKNVMDDDSYGGVVFKRSPKLLKADGGTY